MSKPVHKTALIAAGDIGIRELLIAQLDSLGYSGEAVPGGGEALALLETRDFDLVMLDIQVPGVTGIDVMRRIPKKQPKPHIVLLADVPDAVVAAECFAYGADDYIAKPWTLGHLTERLPVVD